MKDKGQHLQAVHGIASGGQNIQPATTVVTEQAFGQAPAVGTDKTYAREDHTHGTPPAPVGGTSNFTYWGEDGTVELTDTSKFDIHLYWQMFPNTIAQVDMLVWNTTAGIPYPIMYTGGDATLPAGYWTVPGGAPNTVGCWIRGYDISGTATTGDFKSVHVLFPGFLWTTAMANNAGDILRLGYFGPGVAYHGGYFQYCKNTANNWQCITKDGAGTKTTNLPAYPELVAHKFAIKYTGGDAPGAALVSVEFYIDDTLVATHVANLAWAKTSSTPLASTNYIGLLYNNVTATMIFPSWKLPFVVAREL